MGRRRKKNGVITNTDKPVNRIKKYQDHLFYDSIHRNVVEPFKETAAINRYYSKGMRAIDPTSFVVPLKFIIWDIGTVPLRFGYACLHAIFRIFTRKPLSSTEHAAQYGAKSGDDQIPFSCEELIEDNIYFQLLGNKKIQCQFKSNGGTIIKTLNITSDTKITNTNFKEFLEAHRYEILRHVQKTNYAIPAKTKNAIEQLSEIQLQNIIDDYKEKSWSKSTSSKKLLSSLENKTKDIQEKRNDIIDYMSEKPHMLRSIITNDMKNFYGIMTYFKNGLLHNEGKTLFNIIDESIQKTPESETAMLTS